MKKILFLIILVSMLMACENEAVHDKTHNKSSIENSDDRDSSDLVIEDQDDMETILSDYIFSSTSRSGGTLIALVTENDQLIDIEEILVLQNDSLSIEVKKNEKISLLLEENSSIAYEWELLNLDEYELVEIEEKHLNSSIEVSACGENYDKKLYNFSSNVPAVYTFNLVYHHIMSTERNENFEDKFTLIIEYID